MAGMTGSGSAFVVRDPNGIRPAYFYADDEVVVVASEKPAIKTAFNINYNQIEEILPGHALVINKSGDFTQHQIQTPGKKTSCSFERIYFSRGNDPDIYKERKQLGKLLVPQVLKAINFDLKNTVFSYIPNTAESAFYGMMAGIEDYLIQKQKEVLLEGKPSVDDAEDILTFRPRIEKIVLKDVKMRTFIADDEHRDEMVSHVYDTTYEVIRKGIDTLVVIDDSIVRGTTLEKSILKMLDRLGPKKIVVVSSCPQIRYPDCYGIDMSKMGEFVAFRAMRALLKEKGKEHLLDEVYEQCAQLQYAEQDKNYVQNLYKNFTDDEISEKISQIVKSDGVQAEVMVVFQTVENLHKAIPHHIGDWYFTGNYPTSGGMRVVNKSFMNYLDGKMVRAY
jgi:amidophosphoribosyltransferase